MRHRIDKLCSLLLVAFISTILPAGCSKPVGSAASGYPITFHANPPGAGTGFAWQPPPVFSTNPNNLSIQASYFTEDTVVDVYSPFAASGDTYAPKCDNAVWIGWDSSATATTPTYGSGSPDLTMPGSAVELYGVWQ